MIERARVDHLYKYIEIDEETLKFIDCPPIRKMFLRLSKLSQLGIASKIFPSASHTKLEHNLGVYFLAGYLINKAKLASGVIKPLSFKIAAMIHGIGHFPFSLATEIALQKASFLNKSVEDFIVQRLQPVVDRITKNISSRERKRFTEQIFREKGKINHFYRFFTANLLLENEKELRKNLEDCSGFDFDVLLRYLVFPQNIGFKLLHHIDRLDYILRDMFHLGLIKLDLNLPFYFAKLGVKSDKTIEFPPEWEVLDELESYAIKNIYHEQRVKIAEGLYQTIFMKVLFDSGVALAELLEWEDKNLESKIEEYQQRKKQHYRFFKETEKIKTAFDDLLTYNFSSHNVSCTTKSLLCIERRRESIGSSLQKEIHKSVDSGLFKGSYFGSFADTCDIHVNLVSLSRKEIRKFLIEVARYEKHLKRTDKEQIARCIWGDSFSKINFDRYEGIVKKLVGEIKKQKGLSDEEIFDSVMHIILDRLTVPEGIDPKSYQQWVTGTFQLIGIMGTQRKEAKYEGLVDAFRIPFLINPEEALVEKKPLSSLKFSNKQEFLSVVEQLFSKQVRNIRDFRGRILEYFTYLKKICEPKKREDQIKKWTFPSTMTARGEIDVWGLHVFKEKRPLVELVACSTTTSATKKLEDTKKLNTKRAILQERFRKKLEIKMFFNDEEVFE